MIRRDGVGSLGSVKLGWGEKWLCQAQTLQSPPTSPQPESRSQIMLSRVVHVPLLWSNSSPGDTLYPTTQMGHQAGEIPTAWSRCQPIPQ